jgi:hypothetical protein
VGETVSSAAGLEEKEPMRLRTFALLFATVPLSAGAHSITDELAVGNQPSTPSSPSDGFVYDRLGAVFDITKHWDVRGDAMVTHDQASPPQPGAQPFGDSGGLIPFFDIGGDWFPNDHWSLGLELDFSPASTQSNDAPLILDAGTADADLRTTTSSVGGVINLGFDTAGDSNVESAGNVSVGVNHFSTAQAIRAVELGNRTLDLNGLRLFCDSHTLPFCAALRANPADITQGRVALNVTETFYLDTDVGLSGAYYFYDQDPTQVGYFTVATRGRINTGSSWSWGQGLAIAPYVWTIRPDVAHRFGPVRLDLSYQYGQYWPGQGYSNQLGVKTEVKLSRTWKVWATLIGEQDVDGSGDVTKSGLIALGVRYKF